MTTAVRTQNESLKKPESQKPYEPSSLGARQVLIDGLNHDLAGEYQAVLMYTHYAAKQTGPYRHELRGLFLAEIADEQGHAQFLADKIVALGGEPTTQPRPVRHTDQPREMLEETLAAEKQAIIDYGQRIQQAEAYGDIGLKVDLENHIADETHHKEELERIIAGWTAPVGNQDRWQDDGGQG